MYKRKQSRIMYLCAFGLPVLISILICICRGVYPFGRNCILHIDMYHQYEPFFTEFLDKLRNGSSLMYSYRLGLGSDFISLFAYYLASPLNWLVMLCLLHFTRCPVIWRHIAGILCGWIIWRLRRLLCLGLSVW